MQFNFIKLSYVLSLFVATAFGAEIYVSPTGNDSASGSISAPLATMAAARDMADQLKSSGPVTVYFRSGTYYLDTTVEFGPANSGTAQAPILYTAYNSEIPVISGGFRLPSTATWSVYQNSIMTTTIAKNLKIDQLFLNGKRQVLARYPNFNSTQPILDGYAADCISATRVSRWANPGEGPGYVRGLHPNLWGGNSFIITGKNADNSLNMTWCNDNNNGNGLHATYRMVENIFEELDTAGEWFYRKSTGQLFFWPPAGTNLSSATIEFASQDELIRLVGTDSNSTVQYITFNGLTFTHTYRTLFSKPYESILRSDWHVARAGCIFMENADNIQVNNCLFDQIGGNGIFMSGYNRRNLVYNNVFNDAGATCVTLLGDTSSVRCPFLWSTGGTCNDHTPGPRGGNFPAFITVDNNMMNHFGRFEKQTAGVNLGITECDTIRHNTKHDFPRAGINVTTGCFGGEDICYNWLYNPMLETSDNGPFNSWGRDRNLDFQSDTSATQLDAWKTTIIHNNRMELTNTPTTEFALDLDDQSSNYYLYDNLLMGGGGSGIKMQWSRHDTWCNNILVNGSNMTITGVWWGSNDYVTRNIFTSNSPYWCNFFSSIGITNDVLVADTIANHVKLIDSNFIMSSSSGASTESGTDSWTQWKGAGLDVHSVFAADPQFTNVNQTWPGYQPVGDYTIKSGSPALGTGFQNFPMDSFGVMPVPVVSVQMPHRNNPGTADKSLFNVKYVMGQLSISHPGNYTVTIMTAQGRTAKIFKGKGSSVFAVDATVLRSGIYFAVIKDRKNTEIRKFLANTRGF